MALEFVATKGRSRNNGPVSPGSYGRQTVVVNASPRSGERSYDSYSLHDPKKDAAENENDAYPIPLSDGTPAVADWEPMIRAVLDDRRSGVAVGRIARRFHNGLAQMAVDTAQRSGTSRVVLSGGCFQNGLLTERVRRRLLQEGFTVYTHREVPPGDGGIALGQVFVAAQQSRKGLGAGD